MQRRLGDLGEHLCKALGRNTIRTRATTGHAHKVAIGAFHLAHLSSIELRPGRSEVEQPAQDRGREPRILGELLDVPSREDRGTNSTQSTICSGGASQYLWRHVGLHKEE